MAELRQNGQRPRVLVVEDDPELSGALALVLGEECHILTAGDGPSALAILAQTRVDLMLLDLILPQETGLHVLEALQRNPEKAPLVVVMSAICREVDLSPFGSFVVGHLPKPFGIDEVQHQVREALAGRRNESAAPANPSGAAVLLVDDDPHLLAGMQAYLNREGYRVEAVAGADEALDLLVRKRFDVVVSDWIMPGGTGMDLLEQIKGVAPTVPVLILTGYGTQDFTRRAIAQGAADVLVKPFPPRALPLAVTKCLQQASAVGVAPVQAHTAPAEGRSGARSAVRYSIADIVGESLPMQKVRQALRQAAALDSTVLIQGESGTGKELAAQSLHQLSARAAGPFVAVNAAAIPESLLESELFGYSGGAFTGARRDGYQGKFVQADGGTLFLDEIGDLPLPLQAKLLRVLQEGEVNLVGGATRRINVRVLAATHRDLGEMVAQGAFRSDLYYRLKVVTLRLPPLREHREDIAMLVTKFLGDLCARYGRKPVALSSAALEALTRHAWPGNVRELQNVIEQAFVFANGDLIQPVHLPSDLERSGTAPGQAAGAERDRSVVSLDLASREREAIETALKKTAGNKVKAAKLLGISRAGLYVKLRIYGIV